MVIQIISFVAAFLLGVLVGYLSLRLAIWWATIELKIITSELENPSSHSKPGNRSKFIPPDDSDNPGS